jgi:hypothetical protein
MKIIVLDKQQQAAWPPEMMIKLLFVLQYFFIINGSARPVVHQVQHLCRGDPI